MESLAVLVTGTWGTGKSAILDRLASDIRVVAEPARLALAEDPTLEGDWPRFTEALLMRSIADHTGAGSGVTLFDRGVPDCLAYARWFQLDQARFETAERRHRYHAEVLLFPPWEDIYVQDDLRRATFEMSVRFHDVVVATFQDVGYDLVEVPRATVDERTELVRSFVADRT